MLNSGGGGGGGELSRPVYLAPNLPGYQSKIILLILLILNYPNQMCINYKYNSSQIQLFSLLHCSVYFFAGGQAVQASFACPPLTWVSK